MFTLTRSTNVIPVDVIVLREAEIVVRECGDEDDGLDFIETADPLLSLGPLTTDVKQTES